MIPKSCVFLLKGFTFVVAGASFMWTSSSQLPLIPFPSLISTSSAYLRCPQPARKSCRGLSERAGASARTGMRPRGNEACFLSTGADGHRAPENTAKKGIKLLQSAAGPASGQTIPASQWAPNRRPLGECKGKCARGTRSRWICRVPLHSQGILGGWNDPVCGRL